VKTNVSSVYDNVLPFVCSLYIAVLKDHWNMSAAGRVVNVRTMSSMDMQSKRSFFFRNLFSSEGSLQHSLFYTNY